MALHHALGLLGAVDGTKRADAAADVALNAHVRDADDFLAVRTRFNGNRTDAFFLIDFQHVTLSF